MGASLATRHPIPWGARCSLAVGSQWAVGPSPSASRKCHHMPSKEHMGHGTRNSAGSCVGSLSPPPGHPAAGAGRCAVRSACRVSCQYLPCPFALALRAPGLRLGAKVHPPLRASSRGVLPGGPNALSVLSVIHPRDSRFAISRHGSKLEIGTPVLPRGPAAQSR
jgi:hypothetical protein